MKQIVCYLLVAVFVIGSFSNTYAGATDNLLHTGGISVEQDIYQVDENGRRKEIDHTKFILGENMSYVVDVKNRLNACYIRIDARILLDGKEIPNTYFIGVSTDWIMKEDFWYYTKPLQKKERVTFCTGINLPSTMTGKELDIITKVEAIQEYLFTPDFTLDDPFRGIPIEDTEISDNVEKPDKGHQSIEFDESLSSIVDNKNFLSNIGGVMPGQVVSDSFTVTNGSRQIIKLKMKSNDEQDITPTLHNIKLRIDKDSTTIYDGLIYDELFKKGFVLGTVDDNSETTFTFTVSVPVELTNDMAMKASVVNWYFESEYLQKPTDPDVTEPDTSPSETEESTESPTNPSKPEESSPSRPDEMKPPKPDETKPSESEAIKPTRPTHSGGGSSSSSSDRAINSIMYEQPDPSLTKGIDGTWEHVSEEKQQWRFRFSNGTYAKNGWLYIRNPYYKNLGEYSWYHFDDKYMSFGWIKGKSDIWYYGHSISDGDLGTLVKGWHHDEEDGKSYYLDLNTGIMKSGWVNIDNQWRYFAKTTDTFKQNWFWNTSIGRWFYDKLGNRPYGSMYINEMTPDGFRINTEGVWEVK